MKTVESPLPPRKASAHGRVHRAGCPFVKLHGGSDRTQRDDAGRALSSGIYFYRLRTDGKAAAQKLTLRR